MKIEVIVIDVNKIIVEIVCFETHTMEVTPPVTISAKQSYGTTYCGY